MTTTKNRPPSHLLRVPLDVYVTLREVAKVERRNMGAQLAVIVAEWAETNGWRIDIEAGLKAARAGTYESGTLQRTGS